MNDCAFDTMRRISNVLGNSQQPEHLSNLRPLDLARVALACVESKWDLVPSDLTYAEVRLVLGGQYAAFERSLERLDEGSR